MAKIVDLPLLVFAVSLVALSFSANFVRTKLRPSSSYDQRRNYEVEEANAIATEYVRADLLRAAEVARVRESLKTVGSKQVQARYWREIAIALTTGIRSLQTPRQLTRDYELRSDPSFI